MWGRGHWAIAHSEQIEPAKWATQNPLKPAHLLGSDRLERPTAHSGGYSAAARRPTGSGPRGIRLRTRQQGLRNSTRRLRCDGCRLRLDATRTSPELGGLPSTLRAEQARLSVDGGGPGSHRVASHFQQKATSARRIESSTRGGRALGGYPVGAEILSPARDMQRDRICAPHGLAFRLAKRPSRRRVAPWPASWRRSANGSGSGRSPSRTGSRGEARRNGPRLI